jgi:octaheme c-type cytochrome (tetrathionate reductase family)
VNYKSHASCESCHGIVPHEKSKLNDHTDRVACQTCHIPEFSRGGVATKTWWDWSTAGKMDQDGKPYAIMDDHGHPKYMSKKGDFKYEENVVPSYAWFDGQMTYTLRDAKLDDSDIVPINGFNGSADDPKSRIWPFKIMRGKQPYDTTYKTLLSNHVWGKEGTGLWREFDWAKALRDGAAASGLPYSGNFGFVETTMHWPITHMVAPKEDALGCDDCHAKNGRLDDLEGFYLPGRDGNPLMDKVAIWLIILMLGVVLLHTGIRVVYRKRHPRNHTDQA